MGGIRNKADLSPARAGTGTWPELDNDMYENDNISRQAEAEVVPSSSLVEVEVEVWVEVAVGVDVEVGVEVEVGVGVEVEAGVEVGVWGGQGWGWAYFFGRVGGWVGEVGGWRFGELS